jgi:AcrR family transcriptional regulator
VSTPRRYDSRARRAEADNRRATIVTTAARLFLDQGYAETTIAQVAEEAGVSPQLIYAAFGGKAGLLAGALDRIAAGDDQPILLRDRPESLALIEIRDPRERLRAAAAQMADLNARSGRLLTLVDRVAGSDPAVAELQAKMLNAMREDHRVHVDRLAAGMRPDLGPARLADVTRMITGYQMWYGLVVDGGWSQEQYEEWLGDAIVRLVMDPPPRAKR